VKVELAEQ